MTTRKTTTRKARRTPPADPPSPATNGDARFVVSTLSEVAAFFGVALQTVKGWRIDASGAMPGTPGAFNVRDVARWRFAKLNDRSPAGDQLQKLDVAKRAQEIKIGNVKLKKLLAEVVDVDIVEHLISRIIVEHNAIAGELSERIRQMIPAPGAKIAKGDAEEIAENVEHLVDELRNSMAAGMDEWAQCLEGTDGETKNDDDE